MSQPWSGLNPQPTSPGNLPEWCDIVFAIALSVISVAIVAIATWPPNQQFGSDFGSLVLFAVKCSLIASVPSLIYAVAVVAGTVYEKHPGKWAIHPQAGEISVTALFGPWATATVAVLLYVGIMIAIALVIVAIILAALSSIH